MKTTKDGCDFLLKMAKNNEISLEMFIVFLSETGLDILHSYSQWGADGTFSTAPDLFKQVKYVY